MPPVHTPSGKWILYSRISGQRLERWPVDARGMLASGEYTADPSLVDGGWSSAATVAPASETPVVVDPMPHVTKALEVGALSPTGAPLVIAPFDGVSPAAPIGPPVRSSGRRAK